MTREEAILILDPETRLEYLTEVEYKAGFAGVGTVSNAVKEALDMAISALMEQPQWISVEERLPDEFVSVLVYMPGESPLPTVHEGFLAREGVWYANHFDREPMEITHWMQLPEAPKEDT